MAFFARDLQECKVFARVVMAVTHNYPEGIKGGEAVAVCVFLARTGKSKDEIRDFVNQNYYKLDFTLDDLHGAYQWSSTCQGSIPQAIECFLESTSFIDAIRNVISIGGDSDTIAAMTGAIAEAFYGIPRYLRVVARLYCPRRMFKYVKMIYKRYGNNDTLTVKQQELLSKFKKARYNVDVGGLK